jgi:hypothetical protein
LSARESQASRMLRGGEPGGGGRLVWIRLRPAATRAASAAVELEDAPHGHWVMNRASVLCWARGWPPVTGVPSPSNTPSTRQRLTCSSVGAGAERQGPCREEVTLGTTLVFQEELCNLCVSLKLEGWQTRATIRIHPEPRNSLRLSHNSLRFNRREHSFLEIGRLRLGRIGGRQGGG